MLGKDNKLLQHHIVNIIQQQTVIVGDIQCNGDLRLDGEVKGNIKINGRLVMGHDAKVEGIIECENAEISGKIKGDIKVKDSLHLKKHAVVEGDIYVKRIIIEGDAVFNGKCIMRKTESVISQKNNEEIKGIKV